MTNFKKLFVAVVVACAVFMPTSQAFAGQISGVRISIINIYGSTTTPYAVFSFASAAQNSPSCAAWPAAMALDISTTRGKAALQLLTSAFLSGKNVMLNGTGSCVTPSGFGLAVETVNYVNIQ
jgi:hypothetical protein